MPNSQPDLLSPSPEGTRKTFCLLLISFIINIQLITLNIDLHYPTYPAQKILPLSVKFLT
jgi:hypothetical protein